MDHPPLIKAKLFKRFLLVRLFPCIFVLLLLRFAYFLTVTTHSCSSTDSCFFSTATPASGFLHNPHPSSSPATSPTHLWTTKEFRDSVGYFSSVFQELIPDRFLTLNSSILSINTLTGSDVIALKELGFNRLVGVSPDFSFEPLILLDPARRGVYKLPFKNSTFGFIFSGNAGLDRSVRPFDIVSETYRVLKPNGILVVHTLTKDPYSFHSIINLFRFYSCHLVRARDIPGPNPSIPSFREIIFKKEEEEDKKRKKKKKKKRKKRSEEEEEDQEAESLNGSNSIPEYKQGLIKNAEPLIETEPLKPWITLKRNLKNVKYLPSTVDISFKKRYVYVDVGARSYGSSIGSWFKKEYPKQNKTFEVYAIEADKAFHDEYRSKKGVKLLPYAAWVRNETLFFVINRQPSKKRNVVEKGRGMGRIQQVQSSTSFVVTGEYNNNNNNVDIISGFDFAEWIKKSFKDKLDYVVVKMDVEGSEFHLIKRLFETGAIYSIDEMFLECHYNRWQKCCPGVRSPKYEKTYGECLELFNQIRDNGILVHQWW